MSATQPLSPSELFKSMLEDNIDAELIPGGVIVGAPTDAAKDSGCIAIIESGEPSHELYAPLVHPRIQVRCIARELELAERQGRACHEQFNQRNRTVVTQGSTGEDFLIHFTNVLAGPSAAKHDGEHWESVLFITGMIGTQAIT